MKVKVGGFLLNSLLRWEGVWHNMKRICTIGRSVIALIFAEGGEPNLIDLSQSNAAGTRKVVNFA